MNYLKLWILLSLTLSHPFAHAAENALQHAPQLNSVAEANNAFAFDLFQELNPGKGNLCFSPYSISSAFAMVYGGAEGLTKQEISRVFHFTQASQDIQRGYAKLNGALTYHPSNFSEELRLLLANSLWIQANQTLLPDFVKQITTFFKGGLHRVDFIKQPETARTEINQWVKEQTEGKIEDILQQNAITQTTRMVLVSSLYLKARWDKVFDERLTQEMPFFPNKEITSSAMMMTQTDQFPIFQQDLFNILELPYIQGPKEEPKLSFLILLPHEADGLNALTKELTAEHFKLWYRQMKKRRVIVSIPKLHSIENISLKDVLENMGIHEAFSNQANFSLISGSKNLKLEQVLHKIFLAVDESGTEAAAATSISIGTTAILESELPLIFRADHPFAYVIYDRSNDLILFLGKVENP